MMSDKDKELNKWAKKLLIKLREEADKANQDERSHSDYWNGDSWGSISGIRDANEWVENQLINCVLKNARPKEEK